MNNSFLKKINSADKLLTKLTKKQRGKVKVNTIKNERGPATTDTKEIQRIMKINFKNLYFPKMEKLKDKSVNI